MNDDLISRQEAIKAIYDNKDRLNIAQAIRKLPSVNPQEPCEDANANQQNSNALNDVKQHTNVLEGDLISRQAVTDTTICDGISCNECSFFNTCEDGQLGCLLKERVDKLPPVNPQEPKWISVSERLPEEEGLYLVSVKNDHQRRYSKTCYFSRKNWFARQDIIAWMPLPKPYEPQESEVSDADSD